MDWEAGFLAGFDICVASVHSHFDQDRATMTNRFIAAAETDVNIIGHLLTQARRRPPWTSTSTRCTRRAPGPARRWRSTPRRPDGPAAEDIGAAKDAVKFSIDTDAHSLGDLDNMRYGVASARLGGLTDDDVINAWPLARLTEFLHHPGALG